MGTEAGATSGAGRGIPSGRIAILRRAHPGDLAMAAAVIAAGVILARFLFRETFLRDDWMYLLQRRSWTAGTFFDPWVEQLVAIPVLIYKLLASTVGMDSAAPYQLVALLLFLISVVLVFIYARARVGPWLALALVLPILVLGQSWEDLLLIFQLPFSGSMACGVGSLLALDRRDRLGDALATALLAGSLFFSDVGFAFVAGASLEVALGRERWSRAYVVVVPTALFGAWYVGWGHTVETNVSFDNFLSLPIYVVSGLASSISSLLGLGVPRVEIQEGPLDWGRPLLVAAVAVAGWRLHRLGRPSDRLLGVCAIALGFWVLTGLNASEQGPPDIGRYQYIGVVLLVLIAVELARGVRPATAAVAIALVVAGAAAMSNLAYLRKAANQLAGISRQERGALAALELSRDHVPPDFVLTVENSDVESLRLIEAGPYFSAVDAYGSPAYTSEELPGATDQARISADKVFGAALGVGLAPAASGDASARCLDAKLDRHPVVAPLPPEGLVLRAEGGEASVALRRYSDITFPVAAGLLANRRPALLKIPLDRSFQPWEFQLEGTGVVSVCQPRISSEAPIAPP